MASELEAVEETCGMPWDQMHIDGMSASTAMEVDIPAVTVPHVE